MNDYQKNKNMKNAIKSYLLKISENRYLKRMGLLDEHKRELRELNFAHYEKVIEYCNGKGLSVKDAERVTVDHETEKSILREYHEAQEFIFVAESEL